jgi:hypothetical protein
MVLTWEPNAPIPGRFDAGTFPEDEREYVANLETLLFSLYRYILSFTAAIELLKFSEEQGKKEREESKGTGFRPSKPYFEWSFIAVRDAAHTIYQFADVIESIQSTRRMIPTLNALVKNDKMRTATRYFNANFGQFNDVRNAIAHEAELGGTVELSKRNFAPVGSVELEGVKILTSKSIDTDGKFSTSINGVVVSYELSRKTLQSLIQTQTGIYQAFDDAYQQS